MCCGTHNLMGYLLECLLGYAYRLTTLEQDFHLPIILCIQTYRNSTSISILLRLLQMHLHLFSKHLMDFDNLMDPTCRHRMLLPLRHINHLPASQRLRTDIVLCRLQVNRACVVCGIRVQ